MTTPRCFILRHGETEWSLSGKHTGTTDIPLTSDGEKRVRATGKALVGADRLIVPGRLVHIYVSPRHRAQHTLELFGLNPATPYSWQTDSSSSSSSSSTTKTITPASSGRLPSSPSAKQNQDDRREREREHAYQYEHITTAAVTITPAIAEWDYGDYEGLTSVQIRELRKQSGQGGSDGTWDIWTDGCPGGETPGDVIARVDGLIQEIRDRYHRPALESQTASAAAGDVLVVAHGHILRAFAMRWIAKSLSETRLIMDAGGVGTLSYEHKSIDEPAVVLGGAFVVGN